MNSPYYINGNELYEMNCTGFLFFYNLNVSVKTGVTPTPTALIKISPMFVSMLSIVQPDRR